MISKCRKGKLCIKLCKVMNWNKRSDSWKVWSQPLDIDKLTELIKQIEQK